MYLAVPIGPSRMDSSTVFRKKFFFQWSPQFSAFQPLNKNPLNMSFDQEILRHPPKQP